MPEYQMAAHHRLMIREIESAIDEPDGRLYIGCPPRHGKSELVSVRLAAWHIGSFPSKQVVLISYGAELANEFSRRVRALVRDSSRFRNVFPGVMLDPERQKLSDWKTTAGGGLKSIGVQGGLTGHGADLMIIDDPHKEGDAESLLTLDAVYNWYTTAARTRLSPGASIIFVMTRWHLLDLAGRLLRAETGDQWKEIVLPAIAESIDPLGRTEGEALWPARFSRKALLRVKALDDRFFQALYQNNPRGASDVMFKEDDFQIYPWSWMPLDQWTKRFWTFDLATSKSENADYTVIARWALNERDNGLILMQSWRIREEWPQIRDRIVNISWRHQQENLVFPNDLLELLIMKEVRKDCGSARVKTVNMKGDKVQKARAVAVLVENKRFYMSREGANMEFIKEMCEFPMGRHDDCVDAAALAAHYIATPADFEFLYGGQYEPTDEDKDSPETTGARNGNERRAAGDDPAGITGMDVDTQPAVQ